MDASHPQLTEDARNCIEVTARRLVRMCRLSPADLDDIVSELTIDLLDHLPRHDARRAALGTFVRTVVAGKAKRILRDLRRRKRRDGHDADSLDAAVERDEDGNEIALGDTLDADETAITLGQHRRSRHEEAILRLDITAVLSRLPGDLRECCTGIMDGSTVSDMARRSGLPRGAFRHHVICPIRQAFRDAGFGDAGHEPRKKVL